MAEIDSLTRWLIYGLWTTWKVFWCRCRIDRDISPVQLQSLASYTESLFSLALHCDLMSILWLSCCSTLERSEWWNLKIFLASSLFLPQHPAAYESAHLISHVFFEDLKAIKHLSWIQLARKILVLFHYISRSSLTSWEFVFQEIHLKSCCCSRPLWLPQEVSTK